MAKKLYNVKVIGGPKETDGTYVEGVQYPEGTDIHIMADMPEVLREWYRYKDVVPNGHVHRKIHYGSSPAYNDTTYQSLIYTGPNSIEINEDNEEAKYLFDQFTGEELNKLQKQYEHEQKIKNAVNPDMFHKRLQYRFGGCVNYLDLFK